MIQRSKVQTNTDIARRIIDCRISDDSRLAVIQLDFEKAIYRVIHDVFFSVVTHVSCGHIIMKGVRTCYDSCSTQLIINKDLTSSILVPSSVRQGCPHVAVAVGVIFGRL